MANEPGDIPDGRAREPARAAETNPTDRMSRVDGTTAIQSSPSRLDPPPASPTEPRRHVWRNRLLIGGGVIGLVVASIFLIPWVETMLDTVSTDDAYVNSHVTMVAPRVAGQVKNVLVEDNMRVKKGDVLVELDKEPYRVQVQIKQAAVQVAETDLAAARAQVRGLFALARSQRWLLQSAIEQVSTQAANLKASVATYKSKQAALQLARANLKRAQELNTGGSISKEELDIRRQTVKVDEAEADQALQLVHAIRVGLGLPPTPYEGEDLADVPADLPQTFSGVRSALGTLVQTTARIGLPLPSTNATPHEVLEQFRQRDASGDIDKIIESLIPKSPPVQQAQAKLLQAQRDLEQAELNLHYCDIVSEIDGVVTRRNVNPGNNVQVAQTLMAVRSLSEIWIDANFKETQLSSLRIGQRVRCVVDMYGSKRAYEARITGFTMGTGQTLSLLPAENATGNFVKIVQRLPVRVEFTNYDPDKAPLFVGLSVVVYVYYKEPATGPHAGDVFQPFAPLPHKSASPKP
jgi:membrane fusion protein (multidrug efflux system)